MILNVANQKHERQNLNEKKYRSSNQRRERKNFTGDEWMYRGERHPLRKKPRAL